MPAYRGRGPIGPGHNNLFNRLCIFGLAAFAPLVLNATDWAPAAEKALLSTVRVYATDPRTGDTCDSAGVVIDKKGLILTSAHGVARFPELTILVGDDISSAQYEAKVVKINRAIDLALLQAEGLFSQVEMPPIKMSKDGLPKVGCEVAAIGNPLKAFRTMTAGIVSAVGDYQGSEFILFDAKVSQGSSGGPLINAQGELIGIVLELVYENGANLGRALSSREIELFMGQEKPGFIGVGTKKVKTGMSGYGLAEGLEIVSESTDSPFEIGDVLMTFKDYPINSHDDFVRLTRRETPGNIVDATILRKGEFKILKVTILDCPPNQK